MRILQQGISAFYERLGAPLHMLETPKPSTDFLANALHPELERWDDACDKAMEAVIKGYRTPATGDWLPSTAAVLVFLEKFRAADAVEDLPVYTADMDLELTLVLNIGIVLHNIDKEMQPLEQPQPPVTACLISHPMAFVAASDIEVIQVQTICGRDILGSGSLTGRHKTGSSGDMVELATAGGRGGQQSQCCRGLAWLG
ncbi:hypothetical protein K438DRAFT_1757894 [Mycena galopus ATCC 62051]|nr:hypothetical protein K438DRAFT_1757894 [Mycena galopus ATCC 62051]